MNKLSQRDAHIVTSDAFANSINILSTTRSYIERTMVREDEPRNPDFEHSLRVRYNQLVLDKSDELSTCVKLYKQHELRVAEWLTTNHLIAEGIVREEKSGDAFIVGYLEAWNSMLKVVDSKHEEFDHPYHRALDVICVDRAKRFQDAINQLREGAR